MENAFYPLVFRQKYIRRWGLMKNLTTETLSEHSYEVAVTAHALAVIGNTFFGRSYDAGRVVLMALYHDVQEVFTGDLPTPVKYNDPAIRQSYAAIENNATEQFLSKLDRALAGEYEGLLKMDQTQDAELCALVHAADKLCAHIKCIEERKGGNAEFRSAERSTAAALDKYDLPELSWFREHVLPAFECDLDELQSGNQELQPSS